jgi:hypothetical protein
MKTHQIYKKDNWNMLNVEVQGRTIVIREISDQWGEDSHTFLSRPEMMAWVHNRFPESDFIGKEEEYEQLMAAFSEV